MTSELKRRIEELEKADLRQVTKIYELKAEVHPMIEYRPPFLNGLELDAFFQKYRNALEVQGAQHRLHNTSWYKDVKKLEDIVNRDRQKRCNIVKRDSHPSIPVAPISTASL
ncbi:hypothetical protein C1645_813587 [Glomus cerebriforme]|uniref:Uncharacterized protein n=1 Tax=Glomus cerebriforme TaxID=658196 RepID=A0A397TKG3_9GLOM|nr:hypothetical protein C1645_813587 [Glomus cerebriforme]